MKAIDRKPSESAERRVGYRVYAGSESHMALYSAWQTKYAERPRESDKVLIDLAQDLFDTAPPDRKPRRLLDLGCSTGNLLLHLRRALPELELSGVDLAADVIAECRANPQLEGIDFVVADMLEITASDEFDIVVANASLMFFDDEQFSLALSRISGALHAGGCLLAFDLFHPYEQCLSILERSAVHPEGVQFNFRPIGIVEERLRHAAFQDIEFRSFSVPIDLPRPEDMGTASYTVRTEEGERICFRGALSQPWCHLRARKSESTKEGETGV